MTGNPAIRAYCGEGAKRRIVSAPTALEESGLQPLALAPKEHLGLLNGTAFSAGVAALALSEAAFLAVLAQVCTAMGTEALLGTRASFHPFIHDVARPHKSQIEVARVLMRLLDGSKFAGEAEETEMTTEEDSGELRQDRYALRTAPQFIGPQLDDIASAIQVVALECNTTTDNPLIDTETSHVHHGGNFQGMAVTNAMEKARLALHHLAKILFAQSTEILNPVFNRGLPPSVAATDPSHNYHCKGVDIGMAAALSEIGYLANPVSTHIQSAEMHNQSVNSLALISARYTITTIEALSMLMASYIYVLCQALDLRAMQAKFKIELNSIAAKHLFALFGPYLQPTTLSALLPELLRSLHRSLDATTTMDADARLTKVAGAAAVPLLDALAKQNGHLPAEAYASIQTFRQQVAKEGLSRLEAIRHQFLHGERGKAPASEYMGRTKTVYEFVRLKLGIQMHGKENLTQFADGLNETELTIGHNITLIYEAMRDGQMQEVCAKLLAEL
jgi:phenylalanine ammonia-lyase